MLTSTDSAGIAASEDLNGIGGASLQNDGSIKNFQRFLEVGNS
jgi:hypothetical protein